MKKKTHYKIELFLPSGTSWIYRMGTNIRKIKVDLKNELKFFHCKASGNYTIKFGYSGYFSRGKGILERGYFTGKSFIGA